MLTCDVFCFIFSSSGQRPDFQAIYDATTAKLEQDLAVNGAQYLIALGMNRNASFHAVGLAVARACGAAYHAGPLKTEERVNSKCEPGGDYDTRDPTKWPNCARILDMCRASIECKTKAMMVQAYSAAVQRFGKPAVCKDRRDKVQHDVLCVFNHEGFFVEVQFHYAQTVAIKILAHAVFEVRRLKSDVGVQGCGIKTGQYL